MILLHQYKYYLNRTFLRNTSVCYDDKTFYFMFVGIFILLCKAWIGCREKLSLTDRRLSSQNKISVEQ